jgi:hypothetical protein
MKFTAVRTTTLAYGGHVLPFAKGETKFVPPILRPKALEEGFEPEDGAATENPIGSKDAERITAVKDAMRMIRDENDAAKFDGGGAPTMKAIQAIADNGAAPKNRDERLALWAEVAAEA